MLGGLPINDMTYDLVIRFQSEFDTLLSSPDWLDAKSVLFVGDGGTRRFTRVGGRGICVPATVRTISCLNEAYIDVLDFDGSSPAAFYYESMPVDNYPTIEHLKLYVRGAPGATVTGFHHCTIMNDCACTVEFTGNEASAYNACSNIRSSMAVVHGPGTSYGFLNCSRINTCSALLDYSNDKDPRTVCFHGCTGIEAGDCGAGDIGFWGCLELSNCISTANRLGFYTSSHISNCIAHVNTVANPSMDPQGFIGGFNNCLGLSNCESTAKDVDGISDFPIAAFNACKLLVNCTGSGVSPKGGYGFLNCTGLNNCGHSANAVSTTGLLGGTNLSIDTSTLVES